MVHLAGRTGWVPSPAGAMARAPPARRTLRVRVDRAHRLDCQRCSCVRERGWGGLREALRACERYREGRVDRPDGRASGETH
eukprot:6754594-Prymnesium_polylepis.2